MLRACSNQAVILVNALLRGAERGTVFVLKTDVEDWENGSSPDAHGLDLKIREM